MWFGCGLRVVWVLFIVWFIVWFVVWFVVWFECGLNTGRKRVVVWFVVWFDSHAHEYTNLGKPYTIVQ